MLISCSYKAEVANKLNFEFPKSHQLMFEPQLSLRENVNQARPGWHKPVIPATRETEAGGLQIQGQPAQISKILPQVFKSKKAGRHLRG